MKYQVMRIEEDLDFGCEERGADEPVMAVVVLKDENGTESRSAVPTSLSWQLLF